MTTLKKFIIFKSINNWIIIKSGIINNNNDTEVHDNKQIIFIRKFVSGLLSELIKKFEYF